MKLTVVMLAVILLSCAGNEGLLEVAGKLNLKETSGIEYMPGSSIIWAVEDSRNDNKLYGFGEDGRQITEITISNEKNNDWEDITSDSDGNIYIGDFGNNDNDRKNLGIIKIDKASLAEKTARSSSKITFHYPEQTAFPPKKSGRIFDIEAFFEHGGNFYLFTKNRSSGFDGSLNVYKVPNKAGDYAAKLVGTLTTCSMYKKCAVTAADISPDGRTAVLLSGDKIWTITGFDTDNFTDASMQMYELGHFSQKEAICFKDNSTLLIADEKDKKGGGNLYRLDLARLKGKS